MIKDLASLERDTKLIGLSTTWRAVTHQGLMRLQNEDSHLVAHRIDTKNENEIRLRYLFAIADGLGGYQGGAVASRMALESIKDKFHNYEGDAYNLIYQSLRDANQKIFMISQSEPKLFNKMQTTMTAVVLDRDSIIVGHVGDCRLYRARKGDIKLLTRDHTMVNELLRYHLITQKQADQHMGRHQLTRSIGGDPFLDIDMIRDNILPEDTYLLCSDGLWSDLSIDVIKTSLQELDIVTASEKLVGFALRSGGSDNITAIIFRIGTIGKEYTGSKLRDFVRNFIKI